MGYSIKSNKFDCFLSFRRFTSWCQMCFQNIPRYTVNPYSIINCKLIITKYKSEVMLLISNETSSYFFMLSSYASENALFKEVSRHPNICGYFNDLSEKNKLIFQWDILVFIDLKNRRSFWLWNTLQKARYWTSSKRVNSRMRISWIFALASRMGCGTFTHPKFCMAIWRFETFSLIPSKWERF